MSLPNNLTRKLSGVTRKKNIIAIMIGAMILPKNSPNLIHNLLSGVKSLELIKPKNKKNIEI